MKKFGTKQAIVEYVDRLPMLVIRDLLIDTLWEFNNTIQPKKIPITQEQFNAHFRFIDESGAKGRPRKKVEDEYETVPSKLEIE